MTTALARCLPSRTAALLPLPLRAQLPPTFADPRHQPRTVRTPGRGAFTCFGEGSWCKRRREKLGGLKHGRFAVNATGWARGSLGEGVCNEHWQNGRDWMGLHEEKSSDCDGLHPREASKGCCWDS
jgi:hypothetical protein